MLVSVFYSTHMLPSKPPDTIVDLKKSKYKKISNLLAEMQSKGLIQTKEEKGIAQLVAINKAHDDLKFFKPLHRVPENNNNKKCHYFQL